MTGSHELPTLPVNEQSRPQSWWEALTLRSSPTSVVPHGHVSRRHTPQRRRSGALREWVAASGPASGSCPVPRWLRPNPIWLTGRQRSVGLLAGAPAGAPHFAPEDAGLLQDEVRLALPTLRRPASRLALSGSSLSSPAADPAGAPAAKRAMPGREGESIGVAAEREAGPPPAACPALAPVSAAALSPPGGGDLRGSKGDYSPMNLARLGTVPAPANLRGFLGNVREGARYFILLRCFATSRPSLQIS
ncbi:uncharacterized protein PHA67_014595 [Liasis olivaceus]